MMVWSKIIRNCGLSGPLALAMIFIGSDVDAQRVFNLRTELKDGKVTVIYDLEAPSDEYEFDVKLYGSHNNFSTPVKLLNGDAGSGQKPGVDKKLVWSAREEIGVFKGTLQVELSATPKLNVAPVIITEPTGGQVVRRGKSIEVKWTGGSKKEEIELQLTRGSDLHRSIEKVPNTGNYKIKISGEEPLGEYQVRLLSLQGEVFSKPFEVKKPTKVLFKILPVVGLAGVVFLLTGKSSGEVKELPVAPEPN